MFLQVGTADVSFHRRGHSNQTREAGTGHVQGRGQVRGRGLRLPGWRWRRRRRLKPWSTGAGVSLPVLLREYPRRTRGPGTVYVRIALLPAACFRGGAHRAGCGGRRAGRER